MCNFHYVAMPMMTSRIVFKFFFVTFFFLFNIIYNREAYFINYNLQTNKKKLPPTLPIPQVNGNQPLLPTPPS